MHVAIKKSIQSKNYKDKKYNFIQKYCFLTT